MKITRLLLLTTFSTFLTMGPPPSFADPQSEDDCREYDQVFYENPGDYSTNRIDVERMRSEAKELQGVSNLVPIRSPQGTKSYRIREPDFSKEGPWNTLIYIFGNKINPVRLKVAFREHGSGGVHAQWINEKLLSIGAWWGRIVSTDIILDVESGEFVYVEDANYGNLIMPCSEKKLMKGKR